MYWCKDCDRIRRSEWRRNNLEHSRAQGRKNYQNSNGKYAATKKNWAKLNSEKIQASNKKSRQKNKEQRQLKNSLWYKNNPEWSRNKQARRAANKKENGSFLVTKKFLQKLYSSPCAICGSRKKIEADHVLPLIRGGRHSEGNLQPLCRHCNATKNKRTMSELKLIMLNQPNLFHQSV